MADQTIVVAVIGSVTSIARAWLAWRTAERARRTQERTDENAQALQGWKELLNPLREELARERAEHADDVRRMEADIAEEHKVVIAMAAQNEQLHAKVRRLEAGGTDG